MQKPLITTISILGLALFLVGCKSSGGGGENVATVNGVSISKDEYISHLERKIQVLVMGSRGPVQANVAQPLNFQALNDLVNQKLLLQMAKDENVLPTEADVTAELNYQISKRPDFVVALLGQGLTVTDIKGELMISLARHKLLSKGITITEQAVDAYIKENPKEFENHAQASLTWVVVKATEKAKVDADLKTGQTFGIVARQYTIDPGGEKYASTEYDKFPAILKGVVDKLQEGGTSDWLQD
ncbi:MAG: SurA N-terminal domain-containing protein, partial [Armatimonadota bacterium]